jgi:Tfp pilus assembly protein PilF
LRPPALLRRRLAPPAPVLLPAGSSSRHLQRVFRRGRQELSIGRLDGAEGEFRAALASDPPNAAAHRGLAEVARRRGNLDEAVKELQASLQSRDSAFVRTMLAKVYLDQKKIDFARTELERVLKLAPNYTEAKVLLDHLQNSKPGWYALIASIFAALYFIRGLKASARWIQMQKFSLPQRRC